MTGAAILQEAVTHRTLQAAELRLAVAAAALVQEVQDLQVLHHQEVPEVVAGNKQ